MTNKWCDKIVCLCGMQYTILLSSAGANVLCMYRLILDCFLRNIAASCHHLVLVAYQFILCMSATASPDNTFIFIQNI